MNFKSHFNLFVLIYVGLSIATIFSFAATAFATSGESQSSLFKNSNLSVSPELGLLQTQYQESNQPDLAQSSLLFGVNAQYQFDTNWFFVLQAHSTANEKSTNQQEPSHFSEGTIQVQQLNAHWAGFMSARFGGGLSFSKMSQTGAGEGYGNVIAPVISADFKKTIYGRHAIGASALLASIFKDAADLSAPGYRATLGVKYFFVIPSMNTLTVSLEGSTQNFNRNELFYKEKDLGLSLSYSL